MIVTLTAHPSLDRTVALESALRTGEVQQAVSVREDAGGKGVNVARAVVAAGVPTLALMPLNPHDPYADLLRQTGVPTRTTAVAGRVRANIALTDPEGTTTKINLPGARLTIADRRAAIADTVAASRGARWLVLAGSLPPGVGDDFYADVIDAVRSAPDAPLIAVDTSGPALSTVVARSRPDLIKPNDEELAQLTGDPLDGDDLVAQVARAASDLVPAKVGAALVTLGSRGAVLVAEGGAWYAAPPRVRAVSTVGAGDSSLAGYLLAAVAGDGPAERLGRAVRYGAAAASLPGTQIPTPADLPAGEIRAITLTAERTHPAGIAP
ncbi:hexose kinase [Microbacterium invictum]|uniref:Hexose kinase n=1 Tax=Microbacterium invictum TaxID=515415 RepID=A0ABZ0VIJ5_9MICO|nr:hexose kinase [Microbacterium invictum]WQB72030.1 hexose kinase [Microbacterium invictum]